ncbi:proline-rich receptor kinase perk4-like protein [Rutstroemia sp. NJR-2017a BBW]|nr:proline-rich receptor kinase perk4-like protein [Rutstroemia sp. NJR-2017a BBW]
MSNPTTILIEKLKLEPLLRERVFVRWEDQSGTPCTLGSRSSRNRQNLNFFIAVYYDMEGYIHIHFSLEVSIILAGNKQDIEMLLVVPPDVDFADVSKPYSISNIDDLSRRDASAIHDAKISDSLNVLYIQFDLSAKGFIVMKKKPTATIKPRNKTSTKLLCGLESLSNTTTFTVYIKPNDYALVGLEQLHNRIRNTPTDIRKTNMKEMYIEQVPELVEWNRFGPILLPPAYTQNPPQLFPEVQVPRSPSKAAVAETPARNPTTPNSTSVHGIFSPISEELSESEEDWDDIEETSRNIEMNSDVDSDEERLANLNSRELSQQFNYDLEVSKILESKFTEWMQAAMQINSNVYEHKRLTTKLSILGNCVRTSNTGVFDATIPWCSTLLFYDPFDSDMTPGLWEERNSWLLSDMAKLIKWANEVHYGAEMSPLLVNHFVKLGDTARTVALHHGYNDDSYKRQKCVCTTQVFIKFGKPVSSISGENSKPVSRKRLGTDSNTSKRVKI